MCSAKIRKSDSFSGVTELEIYNINTIKNNDSNYFKNTISDITLAQKTNHYIFRFKKQDEIKKIFFQDF